MKSFLQEVSEYLLDRYKDFREVEVIVPNRRTGLFLKKKISELNDKTIWLPKITPIQDIFYQQSELQTAEEVLLIFKLYKIFIKHTGSSESFDDFYYWGEIILSDFDDIDKYLVDAEKLFSTVADIKEIDQKFDGYEEESIEIIKKFWHNVSQAKISTHKESFLDLWKSMYSIYSEFKTELSVNNIAYQGMIYRNVIDTISRDKFEDKTYIILGFNALNKCEKELFRLLKTWFNSDFFWDADQYYIKDNYQEAGRFIRENVKVYPPRDRIGITNNIRTQKKNIEVIMTPSPLSQTKIIPDILREWQSLDDFKYEKTAIVLGDENLLVPLMYSIPETVSSYNISMGYPVSNSMSAAFFNMLISLQQNSRKSEYTTYYFKNVLSILNHNFIRSLDNKAEIIKNEIIANKNIYIQSKDLQKSELLKRIFATNESKLNISAYLLDAGKAILYKLSELEEFQIEVEMLNRIIERLSSLHDCIVNDNIEFENDNIFIRLFNNIIRNLSVAFEGEPLEGLQVLGFLETRSLDFDRVIMLSLNEGTFPKKSVSQSLIPYNLRKFHELPSIEFQDSIFAYYFYRILQRSKDIKIIYSNQSGDSSSEISRFVSQIKYELDQDIKFSTRAFKISIDSQHRILGKKTDNVQDKIKTHLTNGISPKAINEYINCPLKYYLNYIENIKEPDKIEEEQDAALFGRLFHDTAYHLYYPLVNRELIKEDFDRINQDAIKSAIETALKEILKNASKSEIKQYENKIIVDIVIKYIKQLIKFDKQNVPFIIHELESKNTLKIPLKNSQTEVLIKGYIDRIDSSNNVYRILDYKTGSSELKLKAVEELFVDTRKREYAYILQILLYSLMYKQKHSVSVCPGIININDLNENYSFELQYNKNKVEKLENEILIELTDNLNNLFEEILNPNLDFVQTKNEDNCKYCPYKNICMR